MKNNGRSTKDDIEKFMNLLKHNSSKARDERWNWNEEDEKVPNGWKIRACPTAERKYFAMGPSGLKFESIRQALEYMVMNNFSKQDVDTMAKHLIKEGWEKHQLLPRGWYMKHLYTNYLSNSFKI